MKENASYFGERKIKKLVALAFWEPSFDRLRRADPRLGEVGLEYWENLRRVVALAQFTPISALTTLTLGQWFARAFYEEMGVFEGVKPTARQWENIELGMQREHFQEIDTTVTNRAINKQVATALKVVLKRADTTFTDGLDVVMSALIVLAWTAIETLCENLLTEVISFRPELVSGTAGRTEFRKLPRWEGYTKSGKVLKFSDRKGPATLSKLSYRSLRAIRDSYWLVFFKGGGLIVRTLGDRRFDTLHAIRNVFVHTGGVADEMFLERVAGLKEFASVKKGDHLQLDFGMVKNIVVPTLNRGIRLMAAVDTWNKDHP